MYNIILYSLPKSKIKIRNTKSKEKKNRTNSSSFTTLKSIILFINIYSSKCSMIKSFSTQYFYSLLFYSYLYFERKATDYYLPFLHSIDSTPSII